MENALLVGLSRQVALGRELDVVANNVANIETNGFKRRSSVFQEYISPTARAENFKGVDKRVSFVLDQGTTLNFAAGGLSRTDNPLDVAIKGDALFAVQTPQGERYTRDGAFSFNAKGELVTQSGHQVVTDQGVFRLTQTERDFQIAPDGQITTSDGVRGKIKLVKFDNPQSLANVGANEFSSTDRARPAGTDVRLETGAVEKSNVSAVLEMSRLIEINRSYQAVANMMTQTDQLRRTAIQKLADIST
ncbi:MAG: flagellar basal-body rod protein FlgF [Beijerinckiaceae bacterium]|nr:flagellar basal-body rod protein FlgF [Beijerinckiaceae bacterium]